MELDKRYDRVYSGYWEVYLEAKTRVGKTGQEGLLLKDARMMAQIAHYEGIMYLARKHKNWSLVDHYAKRIQATFEGQSIDYVVAEADNPELLEIPAWKQDEIKRLEHAASVPMPGLVPADAPIQIPEVPKLDPVPTAKPVKLPEKKKLPTRGERLQKTIRMGGPVLNKKELNRMVLYLKDQGKTESEIDEILPGWRHHVRG